jgi:transcriptional regulator with PAS, ATPase and Fis domain
LEKKHQVQAIQTTRTGIRLMVVGTPIKNENNEIHRVVNFSRDITQEDKLETELKDLKNLLDGYKQELKDLRRSTSFDADIVVSSEALKKVFILAEKAAEVDSTVVITGESGSGKEIVANYIHKKSDRIEKPFIKINCGAIPETLLESELFGYKKGAFTGASKFGKKGMFELANSGTIFLDEIGELTLPLQVKLFRVIQESEVIPLGATEPIKLDVRIIAATSRDLKTLIKDNAFRPELYYRLNVVPIKIPPLRERKEDILPLIIHFADTYCTKHKKAKLQFPNDLINKLENYDWPGNVRELKNIIERIVVLSDNNTFCDQNLPSFLDNQNRNASPVQVNEIIPLKQLTSMAERQLLELTVIKFNTNEKIAQKLKVDPSTISRKLRKHNIAPLQ